MGRRGFGFSSINRFASSVRANRAKRQREHLINTQSGSLKELPPEYLLSEVEFNEKTRQTKINFQCSKKYRTIERYITQNYQRYPIYSEWKTKITYIKKTIKLTNLILEKLDSNEDDLIRDFSDEIIIELKNEDLIPSWLAKKIIYEEYSFEFSEQNEYKKRLIMENEDSFKNHNNNIQLLNIDIINLDKKKTKIILKISKLTQTIKKIQDRKQSFILSFFTLFIYNIVISKKRRSRLLKKKLLFESSLAENQSNLDQLIHKINILTSTIESEKTDLDKKIEKIQINIKRLKEKCDEKISQIKPLDFIIEDDKDFLLLKSLSGMEYEKIIGCYIIHNTEKNKYYVGQSKDIIKRIKQHFKGTLPNNIIFAEDYFSSKLEDKNKLFKIKIIRCQTKDELDATERRLIEEYDARKTGYNGTNGNI